MHKTVQTQVRQHPTRDGEVGRSQPYLRLYWKLTDPRRGKVSFPYGCATWEMDQTPGTDPHQEHLGNTD